MDINRNDTKSLCHYTDVLQKEIIFRLAGFRLSIRYGWVFIGLPWNLDEGIKELNLTTCRSHFKFNLSHRIIIHSKHFSVSDWLKPWLLLQSWSTLTKFGRRFRYPVKCHQYSEYYRISTEKGTAKREVPGDKVSFSTSRLYPPRST